MSGIDDLQFYITLMAIFSISPPECCCFYSDVSDGGCVRHGRYLAVVYPKLEDVNLVMFSVAEFLVFMTMLRSGKKDFVIL